MPEECTVSACSTTPYPWWDLHHHHHHASWTNNNNNSSPSWYNHKNPTPNSSSEDDVSVSTTSITNASNHSGLTIESSHRLVDQSASSDELFRDHAPTQNHVWSHLLLHAGSGVDTHDSTKNFGGQMIDPLTSKNSSTVMLAQAACDDYLKKMDSNSNWGGIRYGFSEEGLVDTERLNKLSNLVGSWSIAPPNQGVNHDQFGTQARDISLYYKQDIDDLKVKNEELCYNLEPSSMFTGRPVSNGCVGYSNGFNGSMIEADSQYINGMTHTPSLSAANFLDIRLTRPLTDINPSFKPCLKSINLSDFKKKELQSTSLTNKTVGMTNEGKKKRSEEVSDEVSKKPKNGSSTPVKQEPKAKLRDKVTTLQQIVAPFGKTDTASVLQEAITYIKFLQEQVKLLSNPYMKNSLKDPWGGWDREDNKEEIKHNDLRSRGLCLVPTSCTPQVYRESTGSDYWSPTYRGCLYR